MAPLPMIEPMYSNAVAIHAWKCLHQMCIYQMFTSDHQRENYSHNHFSLTDDPSAKSISGRI